MIIREAKQDDLPSLAKVAQDTYKTTFTDLSDDEMEAAFKTRNEAYFQQALNTETILVAVEDLQVVGFIQFGAVTYDSIETTDEDIELNKIYIDKNNQGKGIGKALMAEMMKHPRLDNIKSIYLDVYDKNDKAIGLYKKYGFKTIGRIPFKLDGKIVGYDLLMKYSK